MPELEHDWSPRVSGSNVVWHGLVGPDAEIFLYNGSTTSPLTDDSYDDWSPQVSGSNVVWQGYDGNDYESFLAEPIPEPCTIVMLLAGIAGLGGYMRRRRRAA